PVHGGDGPVGPDARAAQHADPGAARGAPRVLRGDARPARGRVVPRHLALGVGRRDAGRGAGGAGRPAGRGDARPHHRARDARRRGARRAVGTAVVPGHPGGHDGADGRVATGAAAGTSDRRRRSRTMSTGRRTTDATGRVPGTPGRLSRWMQRSSNERLVRKVRGGKATFLGMDVLVLHTVGRRSGVPRETPLMWLPDDGDAVLVVASGGGSR